MKSEICWGPRYLECKKQDGEVGLPGCKFSGNFLISGDFTRIFLISGNFILYKRIEKSTFPGNI